jgi:hypothetical protein
MLKIVGNYQFFEIKFALLKRVILMHFILLLLELNYLLHIYFTFKMFILIHKHWISATELLFSLKLFDFLLYGIINIYFSFVSYSKISIYNRFRQKIRISFCSLFSKLFKIYITDSKNSENLRINTSANTKNFEIYFFYININ